MTDDTTTTDTTAAAPAPVATSTDTVTAEGASTTDAGSPAMTLSTASTNGDIDARLKNAAALAEALGKDAKILAFMSAVMGIKV